LLVFFIPIQSEAHSHVTKRSNHVYEGIYAAVQYKQCELFLERRYLNLVLLPQYPPNEFKTLINLVPAA